MHWLGYNDIVSWLNEEKTRIFHPTANFKSFEIRLPACSHDKGNGGGFMKMLFQRQFTHCAMAISFILLSSSLFFSKV